MDLITKYKAIQNPADTTGLKDESVNGVVTSIVYDDVASDFKIFSVLTDEGDIVKCRGLVPSLRTGIDVRCTGGFTTHPKYGKQFNIDKYQVILSTGSLSGLQGFMASGIIDGLGFSRANEIVEHFQTIERIKEALHNPDILAQVNGIGFISAQIICSSYVQEEHMEAFLSKCFDYGLQIGAATKIYREYTVDAITILESDPYRLLSVDGVSWEVIDKMALEKLNIEPDHPSRISAALAEALKKGTWSTGNVYMDEEQLRDEVYQLLQRSPTIEDIETAAISGVISAEQRIDNLGDPMTIYYSTPLYLAETGVANRLIKMMTESKSLVDAETLLSKEAEILDLAQRKAVLNTLKNTVSVITGFPGTGKTLIEKMIIREFQLRDIHNPLLCAPTGRAAKQMEKSTRIKASTIHRALGYNGVFFAYNKDNPLPYRTVIVDEASMADISLFHHLVDALPENCRLLIIGDVDQLPSVGPGNVLADIIDSGAIPYVRLTHIYRQGAGSSIPILSKAVNEYVPGEPLPDLPLFSDGADVGFISAEPKSIDATICNLVKYRLPKMGFSETDIQVLSPRRKGFGSVESLNKILREALNPGNPKDDFGRFRIGDKVMQIKNVYNIEIGVDVMNGDQGQIVSFASDKKSIGVYIEGLKEISYSTADLKDLTHAYCITVHKSQGGQYPVVVLALLPQHGQLLYRSLLYTAITRAEQKIIIVGDKSAFARAIRTEESSLRQTLLMERLQDTLESIEMEETHDEDSESGVYQGF